MQVIEPPGGPTSVGGYSPGIRLDPSMDGALLFVSGQTPERPDGGVSEDAEGQLRQVWANLSRVLSKAGADLQSLVQVRTYLSDRRFREVNSRVRQDVLGSHAPALTVVICELYESGWVAEIEAVAVVPDET